MARQTQDCDATVAALPIAAAAALLAARWLPLRFEYRPNELGIVSVATEGRYPQQQEAFWAVLALALGTLAAVAAARWLARAELPVGRAVLVEACGATGLAGLLLLPTPLGVAAALAAALGARAAAGPRRAAPAGGAERASEARPPRALEARPPRPARALEARPPRPRRAWRTASGAAALLALALLLTPGLWAGAGNVARGVPDEQRTRSDFTFQGEIGQHLAWADALRRGGFQGRDFFCLYGPLYDVGTAGFWALVGRSIAAFELWFSITRALGLAALLWLAASLASRGAVARAVRLLVPWAHLWMVAALLCLLAIRAGGCGGPRAPGARPAGLAVAALR